MRMKIGIAGTGRMGAAIAQRLAALGHPLMVWNRTPGKACALGLPLAADAKALAT
jgi:3-hydroxyisobutyrate dehydrogenase